MAVFNTIPATWIYTYGSENVVGSFYEWMRQLFEHPAGYHVYYDKQLTRPEVRSKFKYPCIVINQIDTTDPSRGFFGGSRDQNCVMFYVYCLHNTSKPFSGSVRLLRRMKDQVVFALKHAGVFSEEQGDVLVPPILLYDFGQVPKKPMENALTLNSNITQHLNEDGENLEYELIVNLSYLEKPKE